jgi:hypothetical protein
MRLGLSLLALFTLGCDSNPTPHPAVDAAYDARADTQTPNEGGPDEDQDGVPDCIEVGGYWDGAKCQSDPAGVVDTADVLAQDSAGLADANETIAADAEDAAGEVADPGPDAAD